MSGLNKISGDSESAAVFAVCTDRLRESFRLKVFLSSGVLTISTDAIREIDKLSVLLTKGLGLTGSSSASFV